MSYAAYSWGAVKPVNYGGGESAAINYGGNFPAIKQNFGGGEGEFDGLLDLRAVAVPQIFGSGAETVRLDPGAVQKVDAESAAQAEFDLLVAPLDDLYSWTNAKQALPELVRYFHVRPDEKNQWDFGQLAGARRFLSPSRVDDRRNATFVLGLDDLTLENPPQPVDGHNRPHVITPGMLLHVFLQRDEFPDHEKYYVRQTIIEFLTLLARFQRGREWLGDGDITSLIHAVQLRRLKSAVDYEFGHETAVAECSAADESAHRDELQRRTLQRLQTQEFETDVRPKFAAFGLQPPGDAEAVKRVEAFLVAADADHSKFLAGMTLEQVAGMVAEMHAEWRLPAKQAVQQFFADYVGTPLRNLSAKEINAAMKRVLGWACAEPGVGLPSVDTLLALFHPCAGPACWKGARKPVRSLKCA